MVTFSNNSRFNQVKIIIIIFLKLNKILMIILQLIILQINIRSLALFNLLLSYKLVKKKKKVFLNFLRFSIVTINRENFKFNSNKLKKITKVLKKKTFSQLLSKSKKIVQVNSKILNQIWVCLKKVRIKQIYKLIIILNKLNVCIYIYIFLILLFFFCFFF